MSSAVPAPPRGYSSLSQLPTSIRAPQPMPAPLSRVALAAKQNQILALQALQAAAASASASSSSSSSSAAGSPPPSSSYLKSSAGSVYAISTKRGRKFRALRAPSLAKVNNASPSLSAPQFVPLITTSVPHWSADGSHPLFDPISGKRSEIYSLINDRYPGAPGTALAKAREVQQKAIQTAKREAAKKLASKAELEHLGVKGLGKKRKSNSPYAAAAGNAHASSAAQPVVSSTSRAAQDHAASQAMSRDSSRSRSSVKPSSETHLNIPSSSRSRRPPSRASSPAPITAQVSGSRRAGTRSGSAAPAEEDSSSTGASNGRNNRSSPTRGTSPPDNGKNHHGLSSTAPFQSSPLAASAITMEPLPDSDDADQNEGKLSVSDADTSPSAARAGAAKRKASALSQEVHAEEAEAIVADSLDEASKRLKSDNDGENKDALGEGAAERALKEGSPSSVSSSRRTSPRMSSRRIVAEAA